MATKRTGSIGEYDGLVKNDIEAARLKVVDENFEDERCLSSSTKHFDHGEDQPRDVNPSSSVARRMSRASAAYDRGNKGFLDNTERVVRKYDVDGDGVISINEVFKIVEDLSDYKHQKQNLKKYLWMSVMFGMVLLLSVFALMWATIILTRQVTVNGDDSALVSTSTGRILSTKAVGSSLTVDSISTEQQRQRKLQKEIGRKLVGTVEKDRFKRAFGLLRENMDPPTTVEITLRFKDPDGVVSAQLFRAHDYTYTEFNNDAFRIAGLVPASLTTSPDGDDQAMLSYHVDCPKKEEAKCEIFQSIPFVPVVSGVTKTEAVIWFRTDPSFPVRVLVSLQPDPTTLDYQLAFPPFESEATYSSGAESDYTGSIKLTGLNPGTKYFYTVLVHGTHAVTSFRERYGFFQTFPDAGNPFSFTIFADVAFYYVDQPARAYKYGGNKESEEPEHLFALQIGDFDHSDPTNLEEIRTMNQQLRDPSRKHGRSLAANILTKASFNHIWDDHDYCGQDTDKTCSFREDAIKAYKEYWPGYELAQPDEGIWFKFTAGDAEIFVLDTRSQRDPDLLPDPEEGPWEKSMLDGRHLGGNSQLKWLEEGLTTSTAKWKIIISTVTANIHARLSNLDHWMTGFEGEARKIRAIIEENGLKETTLMISADLHSGGAIDDGCNNGFGVTELGVPHTNLLKGNEDNIGVWNIGARDGTQNGGGYGMVKVDSEKLEIWAKGHDGETRVAHSLPYTGETGCFEERYPEPTSEEEQRGLEKCTRNIHQFPVPKPENPQCIGSPRNITLSPPFLNSVTGQYDLENEVEIYKCVETGVRIIKSNDIPDHDIKMNNQNPPCAIPWWIEMPLNPEVMETTDSNGNTIELKFEPSSIIGFSTNGVVAYNALEAGSANAVEPGEGHVPDAQWWFGHADAKNVHHYHAPWLGRDDYETMGGDVHLGYAMDGFPIYGPLSNPDEVLDDCNFDKVNKRYHIRKLSQVDNNLDYCNGNSEAVNWKYIVGCFRGNVRKTLVKDNTSDKAIVHSDCVREN